MNCRNFNKCLEMFTCDNLIFCILDKFAQRELIQNNSIQYIVKLSIINIEILKLFIAKFTDRRMYVSLTSHGNINGTT